MRGDIRTVLGVLGALALGALVVWSPYSLCWFANLTGHACPGCGLTRASLAALAGDFGAAFQLHPVWAPCCAYLATLCADGLSRGLVGTPNWFSSLRWVRSAVTRPVVPGVLALALVAVWGLRISGGLGGPVDVVLLDVPRLASLF